LAVASGLSFSRDASFSRDTLFESFTLSFCIVLFKVVCSDIKKIFFDFPRHVTQSVTSLEHQRGEEFSGSGPNFFSMFNSFKLRPAHFSRASEKFFRGLRPS